MRYLKYFFEHSRQPSVYEIDWHTIVPDKIVVIKGDTTDLEGHIIDPKNNIPTNKLLEYKVGNIMSDLVYQISYVPNFDFPGIPDTLEIDCAIMKENKKFKMNIEITFGDLVVSGFTVESPNKVKPYEYTSYQSKNDPSNTVFAFNEESIQKLISFINKIDSFRVERKDFNFLDINPDSYIPD